MYVITQNKTFRCTILYLRLYKQKTETYFSLCNLLQLICLNIFYILLLALLYKQKKQTNEMR